MKISEALTYLRQVQDENGDLRLAITLPSWALGNSEAEGLMHAFDYGVFVIDQMHRDADGNEAREKLCSVGFIFDKPVSNRAPKLKLVK